VPPEQNGADVVEEAAKLLDANGTDYNDNLPSVMRFIAPGEAVVGFMQPDVRFDFRTNSWLNVLAVVEANRPVTEKLRQVMNYPALDFQLDYTDGVDKDRSHLDMIYNCAQLLANEAICDLREGNAALVTTNICAVLALVNGEQSERSVGSQEIREEIASLAVGANWELLQSTNIDDLELAMLQRSWGKLEFIHSAKNAFLMGRAEMERAMQKARESKGYMGNGVRVTRIAPLVPAGFWETWNERFNDVLYHARATCAKTMWHASWTYSDELQMLHNLQFMLETIRTVETNGFFDPAYTNLINHFRSTSESRDWVNKLGIPDLRGRFSEDSMTVSLVIEEAMVSEAIQRLTVTVIAMKRYQLKYRKYPVNLDALVPEFMLAVSLDPADGKPLRYHLNADGTFLLYSIGLDGVDNGGAASPDNDWLNPSALDWVWPQPATAAEIEYFYAHPPRYF
jgi:hypothetical protein